MAKKIASEKIAKRRITFEINAGVGRKVSVAGSFNDWDAEAKVLEDKNGDGIYRGTVCLAPGVYEYKFVVDGEWRMDDSNPDFAPNDLGTLNSVKTID